jgi:phospholipid transport system substrate-binding protein
MKNFISGLALLGLILWSPLADATSPMATLKGYITKVLDVFQDSALQGDAHKAVRWERLRAVTEPMFAEQEIARRALARHWSRFTAAQQQQFISLFHRLLERVYMDRILSYSYDNEQVVYERQIMLAANRAEVETKIITRSQQIPVAFRLISVAGTWKVYDAVIEGVSLVANYRSQFNEVLAQKSPKELLHILRQKMERLGQRVEKPS